MSRLRDARMSADLNQEQLAEKTGISVKSISAYETGRRIPRAARWSKLAEVLGCSVDDIMESPKEDVALTDFLASDEGRELDHERQAFLLSCRLHCRGYQATKSTWYAMAHVIFPTLRRRP